MFALLVSIVLTSISMLALLGLAAYQLISGNDVSELLWASAAAIVCAVIYLFLNLGNEWRWWYIDNHLLDQLAWPWLVLTIISTLSVYFSLQK